MATVGAIRIGKRIGYFPIVNGKAWTVVYMGREGLLRAIAEASWAAYGEYLEKVARDGMEFRARTLADQERILREHFGTEMEWLEGILSDARFESALSLEDATCGIAAMISPGPLPRFTFVDDDGLPGSTDSDNAISQAALFAMAGYDLNDLGEKDFGTVPQR